ncbi:hypothetical protein [Streptomyces sp. NBC_01455]|uniref:hypothetical protein n=1 Tax=Streptomyces sp. NBC_01455 TaxID=2903874 RepID=UPI002E380016|nr:hypothetical protein [Streptomyces sp. NBC_01455]
MSTMRRLLGTGPATPQSAEPAEPSPRLLPVERSEPTALLDGNNHQDTAQPRGRRALGRGTAGTL